MPSSIEIKKLPNSRTECRVAFTGEERAKAEADALKRLGKSIRVPGFREGKAPADIIREKIGAESLLEETVRSLLGERLGNIIEEHNLHPILPPRISVTAQDPLSVSLLFVEKPAVTLKGADRIKIDKKDIKIEQKDIDRMIAYLQEQDKKTKEVERKAQKGDQVTIDFHGTDSEGKDVPGTKTRNYAVILGSATLLPGFEEALTGLGKDEEKSFTLTFPDDYHAEHLRKKPVTFSVKVTKVEEVSVPEMTDAFVKEHGLGESVKDLHTRIETSLRTQEESIDQQRREQALFEAIGKATNVSLPDELIEEEEHRLFKERNEQLTRQGTTLEDWLKRTKKTPEDFGKELRKQAEQRITLRLGVEALLEQRETAVSDEEMQTLIQQTLGESPEAERAAMEQNLKPGHDAYEQLKWQRRVEKLTDQMLSA